MNQRYMKILLYSVINEKGKIRNFFFSNRITFLITHFCFIENISSFAIIKISFHGADLFKLLTCVVLYSYYLTQVIRYFKDCLFSRLLKCVIKPQETSLNSTDEQQQQHLVSQRTKKVKCCIIAKVNAYKFEFST